MTYFLAYYGLWLAAAFLVGILTGYACQRRGFEEDVRLLRRSDFAPAVWFLLFLAIGRISLGRLALFFESAVLVVVAFVAGVCIVVGCVGEVSRDRPGWRVGAACAALVWLVANVDATRRLEADLAHNLGSTIERAGGDAYNFEVRGRDVFFPAEASGGREIAERIDPLAGVRMVWGVDALSKNAAERRRLALASAAPVVSTALPPASGAEHVAAQRKIAGSRVTEGRSALSFGSPVEWKRPLDPTLPEPDAPRRVAERPLADSASPNEATGGSPCRKALSDAVATRKIHFAVASAVVRGDAAVALQKLAEQMRQCPEAALEVAGHTDAQGTAEENRALSLRRAQSVADFLGRIGVAPGRLTSVGYGAERPLAGDDSPESRAENRRVEFAVR